MAAAHELRLLRGPSACGLWVVTHLRVKVAHQLKISVTEGRTLNQKSRLGGREASELARVCRRAAGTVPAWHSSRETPALGRDRGRTVDGRLKAHKSEQPGRG